MSVLFDHNLPHKLRTNLGLLGPHEIITTSFMRWTDLKNGELLQAAEQSGFDVFVTGDKTLSYEQNLTGRHLSVIALSANNWPIIKERITEILAAIERACPGSFQAVDCGKFSRKSA